MAKNKGQRVTIQEDFVFRNWGRQFFIEDITDNESVYLYGDRSNYPVKVTKKQIEEIFFRIKDLELDSGSVNVTVGIYDRTASSSFSVSGDRSKQKAEADGSFFKKRPYCYQYIEGDTDKSVRKKLFLTESVESYSIEADSGDGQTVGYFRGIDKFIDVGNSDKGNNECCLFTTWYSSEEFYNNPQIDEFASNKSISYITRQFGGRAGTSPSFRALNGTTNISYKDSEVEDFLINDYLNSNLVIHPFIRKVGGTKNDPFSGDLYLNIVFNGTSNSSFGTAFNLVSNPWFFFQTVELAKLTLKLESGDISFPLYYNRGQQRDVSGTGDIVFKPKYWTYADTAGEPVWNENTGKIIKPYSIG